NNIVLNDTLTVTGGANTLTFVGANVVGASGPNMGGVGGLTIRPAGTGTPEIVQAIATYQGPTTVGQIQYATTASPSNPGILRVNGAVGQIIGTSSFNVADGAVLELNYTAGNSVN